ncbi:MAG: hypothetical protein PVJ86_14935 [Phycisphaerales bacterium]
MPDPALHFPEEPTFPSRCLGACGVPKLAPFGFIWLSFPGAVSRVYFHNPFSVNSLHLLGLLQIGFVFSNNSAIRPLILCYFNLICEKGQI